LTVNQNVNPQSDKKEREYTNMLDRNEVVITDIDIPFGRLFKIVLKFAVAAYLASLLIAIVFALVLLPFRALFDFNVHIF
jgi:hypothetical protein